MNLSPGDRFRLGMVTFGGVLGVAAMWILLVEIIRPTLPFFPGDASAAQAAATHRTAAGMAASIGLIRGDLWADYAMTLAPELSGGFTGGSRGATAEAFDNARSAAVRAVELAPHDSRVWLLLAGMDSQRDRLTRDAAGALKMSYYTGPTELPLIPSRIVIATRSDAITDPELQILVGGEIRTIITRKPDLKPLILTAYRYAIPEGKRFIETTIAEIDPGLLTTIRATNKAR
jgi:hypothetical protein